MTLDTPAKSGLSQASNESGASLNVAPLSCGSRWFCCATHPNQEDRAAEELANQFEASYLPLCIKHGTGTRIVDGRRPSYRSASTTGSPLFPGYVFVAFNPDRDAWGACRSTRGVLALIRHAPDRPTPLPIGVVELLQARTSARGIVDDPEDPNAPSPPTMPVGAAVSLLEGPMAGLAGICTRSSSSRVYVLLRLLGREVTVSLDPRHVTEHL